MSTSGLPRRPPAAGPSSRRSDRKVSLPITGRTKVYGVVGDPVSHSLSPLFWNAAFRKLGMDAVYVPFRVPAGHLPEAMRGLGSLGIGGLNITLPHKEAAFRLCTKLRPPADLIGAVNTVWWGEAGELSGGNTDAQGMYQLLQDLDLSGAVTLLGAGGAAKAVLWSLSQSKTTMIYWANRTSSRLVCPWNIPTPVRPVPWDSDDMKDAMDRSSIIINATTLGWQPEDQLPILARVLGPTKTFIDLNYHPASRLLQAARTAGARVIDGGELLVRQGAVAFSWLTGLEAPLVAMRRSLRARIRPPRVP